MADLQAEFIAALGAHYTDGRSYHLRVNIAMQLWEYRSEPTFTVLHHFEQFYVFLGRQYV